MKILICFFKQRKIILSTLFLLLISTLILPAQISETNGEGVIRITFQPFPYSPTPHTVYSFDRLREVFAYVVFVYSADLIQFRVSQIEEAKEWKYNYSIGGENIAQIAIKEARGLFSPENYNELITLFNRGGGIRIYVLNPFPPFLDIPVPSGKYFLAYALFFSRAQNKDCAHVCQNYRERSSSDYESYQWGPPSINISEGQTVNIEFSPKQSLDFLPETDKPFNWEIQPIFWQYINYLLWLGEVY